MGNENKTNEPAQRKRIFVGSSTEHLATAYKLKNLLANYVDVVVWDDIEDGFVAGDRVATRLYDLAIDEYDGGIFLYTPDQIVMNAKNPSETEYQTKPNVVFETGLFAGTLGPDAVAIVKVGNVALPTDHQGVQYIPADTDHMEIGGELQRRLIAWIDRRVSIRRNGPRLPLRVTQTERDKLVEQAQAGPLPKEKADAVFNILLESRDNGCSDEEAMKKAQEALDDLDDLDA